MIFDIPTHLSLVFQPLGIVELHGYVSLCFLSNLKNNFQRSNYTYFQDFNYMYHIRLPEVALELAEALLILFYSYFFRCYVSNSFISMLSMLAIFSSAVSGLLLIPPLCFSHQTLQLSTLEIQSVF